MAHLSLPTTILLILSLTISLSSATRTITTTTTKTIDDSLILDVFGNPLEAGTPYYVRTEVSKVGIGGGIVTASKPNKTQCPQFVGQLSVGWFGESPVKLYPYDPSEKYVHASSDLNIVFSSPSSPCHQGAWQLTTDSNSGNSYLSTDGVVGNSGSTNWFKIEKVAFSPEFYQLQYCPSSITTVSSSSAELACGVIDVVDFTDNFYLGWLGLTPSGQSFNLLSFVKA